MKYPGVGFHEVKSTPATNTQTKPQSLGITFSAVFLFQQGTKMSTKTSTKRSTTKKKRPLSPYRQFTEAELMEVAVPEPFSRHRMKAAPLVPDSSKWECFECGKVIGTKKICPFCSFDSRNA